MMQQSSAVSEVTKAHTERVEAQFTVKVPVLSIETLSDAKGTKNHCWTVHTVHLAIARTLRMQVLNVIFERQLISKHPRKLMILISCQL